MKIRPPNRLPRTVLTLPLNAVMASFLTLAVSRNACAFLDTIATTAKEAAKAAAYVDAVAEVADTLDGNGDVTKGAERLNNRVRRLNNDAGDTLYQSDDLREGLDRDWSKGSLENNVRFTSQYIKQVKRFFITMGLFGTDMATALNTAETNNALNQVLKNQQAELLLHREDQVDVLSRDLQVRKDWDEFIKRQQVERAEARPLQASQLSAGT